MLLVILLMGLVLWRRWLPALVVMPLTALVLAIIALSPDVIKQGIVALNPLFSIVIEEGVVRLSTWISAVILGCILAAHISINGSAEAIIRWTAEFGGDRKLNTALLLTAVIALMFTTLGGLGAVIMVSSLAIPLMLALRIPPIVAGTSFLLGLSLGGCFNPANWAAYISTLKLETSVIVNFAVIVAIAMSLVTYLYLYVKLRDKRDSIASFVLNLSIIILACISLVFITDTIKYYLLLALGVISAILILLLIHLPMIEIARHRASKRTEPIINMSQILAPLFPLLLLVLTTIVENLKTLQAGVLGKAINFPELKIGISTALMLGILYSVFASVGTKRGVIRDATQAIITGAQQAAAPVVLLIGIGMLLKATSLPQITAAIQPLIVKVLPSNEIEYVVLFAIIAPLSMYRGPLNLYGMGAGLLELLATKMSPARVMATFLSVGQLQGVSDPTNTHNVYLADRLGVPVQELTRQSMPWVWGAVVASLILASLQTQLMP